MIGRGRSPVILASAAGAVLVISLAVFLNLTTRRVDEDASEMKLDRIVFSGIINSTTHQIFTVKPDGSELKNLTGDDLWHFNPKPSPDGSKIAYETWNSFPNAPIDAKLIQHLYTVNADGTEKIRVTPEGEVMTSSVFSWSPDSMKIAYESSEDIYVVNADGTDMLRLTQDGRPIPEVIRIDNHNPFWLANDTIAFSSTTFDGIRPISGVFREIKADGTGLKALFDFDPEHEARFVWSNDRQEIVFLKLESDDLVSLYLTDASRNRERLVIDSSRFYVISNLAWSPNDSKIAFVGTERSGTLGSGEIFILDVSDEAYRRLQGSDTLAIIPVWSSDGGRIAFMKTLGETISINVIDINSLETKEIVRIEQSIVDNPLGWISTPALDN